ncbi:MAG: hypothetical protein WCP57_05645 [Bacteroidota bacterium]
MDKNSNITIIDNDKENNQKQPNNSRRNKYILLAVIIFIAVFIYDIDPVDLMPLIPIDDIAVTGGGFLSILALFFKYWTGKAKK